MFSKLNKWLNRDPRPPLDDAHAQEIAKELYAPILEASSQPAPALSSQQFQTSDIAARVRGISWFAHCGQPSTVQLLVPVRQPRDWAQAVELCHKAESDEVVLDGFNCLSGWLSVHAHRDYQQWNKVIQEFRETVLLPVIHPAVEAYCRQHGLEERIKHWVGADVMGAWLENHYLYTGHRVFYFLELLKLYEAGHFPCGWTKKDERVELNVF
jgi:hypothetical protein